MNKDVCVRPDTKRNLYVKRIAVSPSLAISKTQLLEYIYVKYFLGSFDNLPHILTTISVIGEHSNLKPLDIYVRYIFGEK